MKKIEQIEVVQAENKEKLDAQDEAIKKNAGKMEEMEKKSNEMEKRLKNVEGETPNIRQTNAVIREIREMEKREKNLIFCNILEQKETEAEERKKKMKKEWVKFC